MRGWTVIAGPPASCGVGQPPSLPGRRVGDEGPSGPLGRLRGPRSDRQRHFPHQAGENEQAAQAVAVALVRQEEAAEADQCSERHSDLTSSVHVSFPQCFPPMNLGRDDRFLSLREAFVIGGIWIGGSMNKARIK
jgi:hypothetical protein